MTLEEIRKEIDAVDNAMKPLFVRRMACAGQVAEVKSASRGDVYAPEREREIIERRLADVPPEIREEYGAYLRHLMSVCRRYEYGIMDTLIERVVSDIVEKSGFSEDTKHRKIELQFCCGSEANGLHLFLNMAALNKVRILEMKAEFSQGKHKAVMLLEGSLKETGVRRLLCQIGKEAEDVRILRMIA